MTEELGAQPRRTRADIDEPGALSTLLSHLPGMAYRRRGDGEGTMDFVSDGCLALTGYAVADLVHGARLSYLQVIHPDDLARVRRELADALLTKLPFHLTYRIVTADGMVKWVWDKGEGLRAPDGSVVAVEGFIEDVTAEILFEEHLQTREAVLEESQRIAEVGSWECDARTRTSTWSKELWRIFGRAPASEAITMRRYLDFVHPDDREAMRKHLDVALASGKAFSYEHRIVRLDGEIRHVEGRGLSVTDHNGDVVRVIGTGQDITERKRENERNRFLADASALLVESLDEDELLRRLAALSVPLLGDFCLLDIVSNGQHKREIAAADLSPERRAIVEEAVSLIDPFHPNSGFMEMMAVPMPRLLSPVTPEFVERLAKQGRRVADLVEQFEIESVMMVPLVARNTTLGMLGFITGPGRPRLTERDMELAAELGARAAVAIQNAQLFAAAKQELVERKRLERERETTEVFLQAFFESHGTFSCVLDIDETTNDFIFVMPNGPYAESYGLSPAAMAGKTARGIGIPEDRIAWFVGILRACRASDKPVSLEISPTRTVDRVWRLGNISPFMLNGRPLFAYVATDITERKQLEAQFLLAQKMEAVALLAGGIAHDFNNLITVIGGFAELAIEDITPEDPGWDSMVEIRHAADRAGALTRQLLALSRRQPAHPQLVDVNDVVKQAERMLRRLIGVRITLDVQLAAANPIVHMDSGQLEQILVNLVVNARDAMPNGGRIAIATAVLVRDMPVGDGVADIPGGEYVTISVQDSGVGMDEATRARIFEPFYTTKEHGKGTGLGLATVFTIVKSAGGRVDVKTLPGTGSTFVIHLPMAVAQDASAAQHHAPKVAAARGSETVLLVEDEPYVRRFASRTLTDRGYSVFEASSGTEALEIVDALSEPLHLLVTDLTLPELDGPELADIVAKRRPGLKVLFMSGHSTETVERVPGGQITSAVLEKPFNATDLAIAVRAVLDGNADP